MKKLMMILIAIFMLCSIAESKEVYVTSNTVSFSTTAFIVTFNTTVNHIYVRNDLSTGHVNIQFDGAKIGWDTSKSNYILPTEASSFRLTASKDITIDVSTDKIGFISNGTGTITYLATSDKRTTDNTIAMLAY